MAAAWIIAFGAIVTCGTRIHAIARQLKAPLRNCMRPSSALLVGVVKLLVGAYARWIGTTPSSAQRIYFANHTSHIDTLAIWSSLPRALRPRTRPIAARDYWGTGLRKYIATRGFGAVLIDRAACRCETRIRSSRCAPRCATATR